MPKKTAAKLLSHTTEPRHVKAPKRKFYKRQDKRFKQRPKLANSFAIAFSAAKMLLRHWKVNGGIVLVYGVLNVILVHGLNGGLDVSQLKNQFDSIFQGATGHIASGFTVFALLIGSNTNITSSSASAFQTLLFIFVSLALVWAYRQQLAGHGFRVRDAFYQGMSQLVPVILVLLVIALQLLPMVAGLLLFGLLFGAGIAVTFPEQAISFVACMALILPSIYWICSSTFAVYIATLPGMTPVKALRSARELVRYRRWSLIRKILFVPFALLVIGTIIIVPCILLAPVLAQWLFFVLATATLAIVHSYMYTLYRELLHE